MEKAHRHNFTVDDILQATGRLGSAEKRTQGSVFDFTFHGKSTVSHLGPSCISPRTGAPSDAQIATPLSVNFTLGTGGRPSRINMAGVMKLLAHHLLVALLRLLTILPYALVARIGSGLGALAYEIPGRRKKIALTNLRLCFPKLSDIDLDNLARANFQHIVRSYLERGYQWYGSSRWINRMVQVDSRIDLVDPNAPPTIFMGFHFVGIEAGCMLYSSRLPVAALYTRMSNTRLCELAKRQRGRFGANMIERCASARDIVRLLRARIPVMLAADMDHGTAGSVFAPLFGVPACTLTSVSRLARLSGARVVPFVTEVLPEFRGYKLTIFEPLANFPSGHDSLDACAMNSFLERLIVRFPEQYYWVHRRFKHRPQGTPAVY
jgi:KDO2-lipid IV(A) lauroyltransferase